MDADRDALAGWEPEPGTTADIERAVAALIAKVYGKTPEELGVSGLVVVGLIGDGRTNFKVPIPTGRRGLIPSPSLS